MTIRKLILTAALAVMATGALASAPAHASIRSDADAIMNKDYKQFIAYKQKVTSVLGPYLFNWSDDGCSIPGYIPGSGGAANLFDKACQQHDFGYRNYGKGLKLSPTEDTRAWIDHRLYREAGRICDDKFSAWYRRANWLSCQSDVRAIYGAVRNFGRGAFYG